MKRYSQFAARPRAFAVVVEDKFDPAVDDGIIQRHFAVDMPGLDRARLDAGEINLAELVEMRRVAAQHVHDLAALVRNLPHWCNQDAVDHVFPLGLVQAAQASVFARASATKVSIS